MDILQTLPRRLIQCVRRERRTVKMQVAVCVVMAVAISDGPLRIIQLHFTRTTVATAMTAVA